MCISCRYHLKYTIYIFKRPYLFLYLSSFVLADFREGDDERIGARSVMIMMLLSSVDTAADFNKFSTRFRTAEKMNKCTHSVITAQAHHICTAYNCMIFVVLLTLTSK